MALAFFENLFRRGLVSEASLEKLKQFYTGHHPVSLHNELRAILYLGILLISSGMGVLVYKHIGQIGHLAIITSLLVGCLSCFGYCFWQRPKIRAGENKNSTILFDYIVLLGCLLLLILIGYMQSQFQFFGHRLGLATFIPMVLLFASAYYFDHKGILSLGIINLAAWVGININRKTLYGIAELNQKQTIIAAFLLGVFLVLVAIAVKQKGIKAHFENIYHQFGSHALFISGIAGIIMFENLYLVWLLLLLLVGLFHYKKAFREKSFYYLVITCLYCYVGLSYTLSDKLFSLLQPGNDQVYANLFYYLSTGVGLAYWLTQLNKKMNANASL
jgi:hypothetical protein